MAPRLALGRWIPAGPILALAAGASSAQGPALNEPLSRLDGGSVRRAVTTRDGKWVVYAADQQVIGEVELWCASLTEDEPPFRISPPFESSTGNQWDVSPDGRRAVYLDGTDLYSVPIDRSSGTVRINEQPVRYAWSAAFRIAPDGTRVAFLSPQPGPLFSLYSAPIDGSSAPLLLQASGALGGVGGQYEFSPDGSTIVFPSVHADGLRIPLYSVPVGGGPVVQLTHPVGGTGHFVSTELSFADGGERVVFASAELLAGPRQLFSVPLDGSQPPQRLNGALVPGGEVLDFEVAPDGERVVYLADQRQNGKQELFAAPADGGAPAVVLNSPLAADRDVNGFDVHPGSAFVAYRSDQELDERAQLFGVPIDASRAPVELGPPLVTGADVGWFKFTPDGRRMLVSILPPPPFTAPYELWRVDLARGLPKVVLAQSARFQQPRVGPHGAHVLFVSDSRLHAAAVAGGAAPVVLADPTPPQFDFHPDGARVLLLGRSPEPHEDVLELFLRRADGGAPGIRLNGPLVLGEIVADVLRFRATPDGRWLVYHADGIDRDEDPDVGDALFALRTDAQAAPLRLFPHPAIPGGLDDVHDFRVDAANERVVLYSRDAESEFFEGRLHAVSLDGGLAPVALNSFSAVRRFELSPDGAWTVFTVDMDDAASSERVFASRPDGSAFQVELSGPLAGPVRDLALTADSLSVVFLARRVPGGPEELARVPLDGSAPASPLGGPLVAGGNVQAFALDALAQRVVFRADRETDGVDELWSAPLAGGAATKLNGALVAGGDVTAFALSHDGARVVYAADEDADGILEPFVVPTAGGPALRLAPPFAAGGGVLSFVIAPGDARVVYLAEETPGVRELFWVPLDASAAPTKLSGALVPGGDVRNDYEIAADGARVVFTADALADGVVELFSARLAAPAAPPVRLSSTLAANGDVQTFRLSPDGRRVAFVADASVDELVELYGVPIEGGAAPRRLSNKLAADRDVRSARGDYAFHADSNRVFHVADWALDEVHELFAGRFELLGGRAR